MNKKDRAEYYRNYWKKNPKKYEEQKKRTKEYNRKIRAKLRAEIIKLLGGKCIRCEFNDWRAVQIDHVHGGGTEHRRKLGGSSAHYHRIIIQEIKAGSKDYQLLCANCNWIKRYENKEYS